jgi:DNA topoisomerase IB
MLDKKKPDNSDDNGLIAAAERAQLVYVSDSEPGIRRKGTEALLV